MAGPKKWNGAKMRHKRPQTAESKASYEQDVGKIPNLRRYGTYICHATTVNLPTAPAAPTASTAPAA